MKTAIIYTTKYGSTAHLAGLLSNACQGEPRLFDLAKEKPSLAEYDTVLLGGPIYAGRIPKGLSRFCKENEDALAAKNLGLFLCGMGTEEDAKKSLEASFSQKLLSAAKATGYLGGAYDFKKMNPAERFIVAKISGTKESSSKTLEQNILDFANVMTGQN